MALNGGDDGSHAHKHGPVEEVVVDDAGSEADSDGEGFAAACEVSTVRNSQLSVAPAVGRPRGMIWQGVRAPSHFLEGSTKSRFRSGGYDIYLPFCLRLGDVFSALSDSVAERASCAMMGALGAVGSSP